VAAKRVPFFKVGKELRLRVDGKSVDEAEGIDE
jgi:nucleoid DNA-binding protein